MENNTFKGSIFGGFNRQDVMNYIEKSSKESAQLLEENAEKISELEKELQELRTQFFKLQDDFDETSSELNSAKEALDSAKSENKTLQEQIESSREGFSKADTEVQSLTAANEALQLEVDEFHELKNHIAEIELEGKQRSEAIVNNATCEAAAILKKAKDEAEYILNNANAKAEKTLSEASLSAAATRQKAEQHAMLTRQQLTVLLTNCQNQYSSVLEAYKKAALQAASDLQKAQENMAQLPTAFEKISDGLKKLSDTHQKKD